MAKLKKKNNTILIIVIVIAFFIFAQQQGFIGALVSLHSNSGFEDGLTGWTENLHTGSSIALDSTESHSGLNSVKLISDSTGSTTLGSDYISVTPGLPFTIGFWGKGENIVTGANPWDGFQLIGRFYSDTSGNFVENPVGCEECYCEGHCFDVLGFPEGNFDWTYIESSTTAVPSWANYYKIIGVGIHVDGSGTAWIDDVVIEMEVPEGTCGVTDVYYGWPGINQAIQIWVAGG